MRRYLATLILAITLSGFQYILAQAPEIVEQPSSGIKCLGNHVAITLSVTGSEPLTYQWYHDENPVGTNSNVYEIIAVDITDEGYYYCEISNSEGSITSWEAQLLVASGPPEILSVSADEDNVCLGETIVLNSNSTGDYVQHKWYNQNDEYINIGTSISINNADINDEDSYYCVAENVCGSDISDLIEIEIIEPAIIVSQPSNQTVCEGEDAIISIEASGEYLLYKWLADGIDIPDANTNELTVNSVVFPNNISYKAIAYNQCTNDTSLGVSIIVKKLPEITGHPLSQDLCTGESITLYATATSNAPQSYQWYLNDSPIVDANENSLSVVAESEINNAYTCMITNMCGSVVTDTAFIYGRIPPEITLQPLDTAACIGESVSINCKASGDEPIYYQWLLNGADVSGDNISGEQTSTIIIDDLTLAQQGNYTCLAYNNCGQVLTEQAYLTVNTPPTILVQPEDITVCEGDLIEYDLLTSGTLPMEFEWINQTSSEVVYTNEDLFIESAELNHSGTYYCSITNTCGNTESDTFEITVDQAPLLLSSPSDISACEGDSVAIFVEYEGTEPIDFLWYRNNSAVSWADNDTILLSPANFGQTGTYFCRLHNSCGDTDSDPFYLHIGTPPVIALNPLNKTLCELDTLALIMSAAGENILYQWYHNDIPINGATDTSLNIPNIDVSYQGEYFCKAYNACENVYTDTVEVTIFPAPELELGPDMDYCEGTEVILSPEGDYQSYNWNNGLNVGAYLQVQLSGTYTLMVVGENGCSNYDTVHIAFHPVHEVNFGNDTSVCGGMVLDAGEGAYSYDWSNGSENSSINITESGVYSLTTYGDEFGCTDSDTVTVQVLQIPEIDLGDDITISIDSTLIIEVDPIYEYYLWNNDFTGPSLSVSGSEYGEGSFEIWLQITAYNGCQNSDTIILNVFDNSIVPNIKDIEYLKLYPIPANDILWIEGSAINQGIAHVKISNLNGQIIFTKKINQTGEFRDNIDIAKFAAGTYILQFISSNNNIITQKFIIK